MGSVLTVIIGGTFVALLAAGVYKAHNPTNADVNKIKAKMNRVVRYNFMDDYWSKSNVDEGYEFDKEKAAGEAGIAKWSQEDPADYISITSISLGSTDETQCDDEDNAVLVVPKCAPPKDGWPGLVIVPGKSGAKERHTVWSEMLGGRGIATMNFDMCPNNMADQGDDVMRAVNWMKSQAPGGE